MRVCVLSVCCKRDMRIINNSTDFIRHTGTQMLISVVYLIAFYFCFFFFLFAHAYRYRRSLGALGVTAGVTATAQQQRKQHENHNSPLFLERHGAKANELMRTRDSSEMLEPSSNFFKSFRLIHLHSHTHTHPRPRERGSERASRDPCESVYVYDGDESHSPVGGITNIYKSHTMVDKDISSN